MQRRQKAIEFPVNNARGEKRRVSHLYMLVTRVFSAPSVRSAHVFSGFSLHVYLGESISLRACTFARWSFFSFCVPFVCFDSLGLINKFFHSASSRTEVYPRPILLFLFQYNVPVMPCVIGNHTLFLYSVPQQLPGSWYKILLLSMQLCLLNRVGKLVTFFFSVLTEKLPSKGEKSLGSLGAGLLDAAPEDEEDFSKLQQLVLQALT